MYLILCFLYCFFAIVLGTYLGLELISVRKADRIARTILKAAAPPVVPRTGDPATEPGSGDSDTPNYFATK